VEARSVGQSRRRLTCSSTICSPRCAFPKSIARVEPCCGLRCKLCRRANHDLTVQTRRSRDCRRLGQRFPTLCDASTSCSSIRQHVRGHGRSRAIESLADLAFNGQTAKCRRQDDSWCNSAGVLRSPTKISLARWPQIGEAGRCCTASLDLPFQGVAGHGHHSWPIRSSVCGWRSFVPGQRSTSRKKEATLPPSIGAFSPMERALLLTPVSEAVACADKSFRLRQ